MSVTVGKFEVRCQPMGVTIPGTREQRFQGHWSVYLLPVDEERDEPAAEGQTGEFPNAALAEQEGFRLGTARATILDSGYTGIESGN